MNLFSRRLHCWVQASSRRERRFFHNDVACQSVGPRGNRGQTAVRQWLDLSSESHCGGVQGRRQGAHVERRHCLTAFNFQAGFDQACHARGAAKVSELRRQRANLQRCFTENTAVCRDESLQLLARCVEAFVGVQLGQSDLPKIDAGTGARTFGREPQRFSGGFMVSDSDSANDSMDSIAIAPGVGQTFDDHDADSLARHNSLVGRVQKIRRLGGIAQ